MEGFQLDIFTLKDEGLNIPLAPPKFSHLQRLPIL